MNRNKFFKSYKNNGKSMDSEASFEHLASIFHSILKKRTKLKHKSFTLFDENLIKLIGEPLDHQVSISNNREACIRLIYTKLSRNDIVDALAVFTILLLNFKISTSFLWRTGFHILSRIGDNSSMKIFFNTLLEYKVWDPSNMIYEYLLYLLEQKKYDEIKHIYRNQYSVYFRTKRFIRESEMEILNHYIRLIVAVSYYATWKQSLNLGSEDEESRIQAELEFKELFSAIDKKLVLDPFILNYLDLLEYQQKFSEALRVLKRYHEKCPNNIHTSEYLLDFLSRNQYHLQESVTNEDIVEIRTQYIEKHIQINPNCSLFLLQAFKVHIENLNDEGNHEEIVRLLFKYLSDVKWGQVEWPWRYLLISIRHLGASSDIIQNLWIFIKEFWNDEIFSSPRNSYIKELMVMLA